MRDYGPGDKKIDPAFTWLDLVSLGSYSNVTWPVKLSLSA